MQSESNITPGKSNPDPYDITGQTIHGFLVVRLDHIRKGRRFWLIKCERCGTEYVQPLYMFKTKDFACDGCAEIAFREAGLETPEWLQALGFDKTFWSRYWPKVNKDGPVPAHKPELGPCWIWTAGVNSQGYGCIAANLDKERTELIAAHRASWIIEKREPIPDGLWVLHHCDTPRCVRPSHLFLGDGGDNSDDMIEKGRARHPAGEAHPNAILTAADVIEIRRLHSAGMSDLSLAARFRCSIGNIRFIVRGQAWKHLL